MQTKNASWKKKATLALGVVAGLISIAGAVGISAADADPTASALSNWTDEVWASARQNDETTLVAKLDQAPTTEAWLTESADAFAKSIERRETLRAEKLAAANTEFEEHLAEGDSAIKLSEALVSVLRMQLLMEDDAVLFADERIKSVVDKAVNTAREAEAKQDWLIANELYFRLASLYEDNEDFQDATDRLTRRLAMIRLYSPERLWELRNARRIAEKGEPFPPYNPYGNDFREKLSGIEAGMVQRALQRAAVEHVEGVDLRSMITSGLDAVEVFVTTPDLANAFPGLKNQAAVTDFSSFVTQTRTVIDENDKKIDLFDLRLVLDRLRRANEQTIAVMPEALLHEFGNGAMSALDDYSAFIWPDEMARFERSTRGQFVGVGIQIQLDESLNVKVVTPLQGQPAQRAGVKADDIIKKVDGRSIIGFGLDQAVEVITGEPNTKVTLTVERENEAGETKELDFVVTRTRIDLPTVKGWQKTGGGDDDWNWFIDESNGIGYLRLSGFTEDSTKEFDDAIEAMRKHGLNGLVFDLRFNPGGLLDQAIKISNRFVDKGLIVKTEDAMQRVRQSEHAGFVSERRRLDDIPVVVLINEGSASASEIVSGAIQAHAQQPGSGLDAILIGQNSFGKGSVQNVHWLPGNRAMMKLTTQYYKLRTGRQIHKLPGATEWGIKPDLEIEMIPDQITEALTIRRDADALAIDGDGNVIDGDSLEDPNRLLTEGHDLQLQAAVVMLQTKIATEKAEVASNN